MLELYKRIILSSIGISIFCFSLAFCSYLLRLQFIMNCAIGIGSSLLVVIITTYIQFKSQRERIVDEIINGIEAVLSKEYSLLVKGFSNNPDMDYSELSKSIRTIAVLSQKDLFILSRKKNKPFEMLSELIDRLELLCAKTLDNGERLSALLCKKYYVGLAKSAIRICKYDFQKTDFQSRIDELRIIESRHPIEFFPNFEEYKKKRVDASIPIAFNDYLKESDNPDLLLKVYKEQARGNEFRDQL